MNASEFCEKLKLLTPDRQALEDEGLEKDEIIDEMARYDCRLLIPSYPESTDPVVDLVRNYDVTSVEIGIVNFRCEPSDCESGFQFGQVESDPLVIDAVTGFIEVRDLYNANRVLWVCARTGSMFLESLIEAAAILDECNEDSGEIYQSAIKCSEMSGGEMTLDFYLMLLGYEEE